MIHFWKVKEDRIRHIGDIQVIEFRQGYNKEMEKYWIQLFDRKSKDTTRIFLTLEEWRMIIFNAQKLLQEHSGESK